MHSLHSIMKYCFMYYIFMLFCIYSRCYNKTKNYAYCSIQNPFFFDLMYENIYIIIIKNNNIDNILIFQNSYDNCKYNQMIYIFLVISQYILIYVCFMKKLFKKTYLLIER